MADFFRKASSGTRPEVTYLASPKTNGSTTATLNAATGWNTSTEVDVVIFRKDASGALVAGSQTDWVADLAGTTLSNMVLRAGTEPASGYPAGELSVVKASPTAAWGDDLATGILTHADQDGTLKAGAVDAAAVLASDVVTTAKILNSNVTDTKVANGFVVQMVSTAFSAVATGTTTIPLDDTIPQSGEGDEYMTQAITPKSATNILVIEATIFLANSAANAHRIAALFQDATANALAVANDNGGAGANDITTLKLTHRMVAGTTSATTFKIRAGANVAGTTTFNGQSGARLFGAITKSTITITEYKA